MADDSIDNHHHEAEVVVIGAGLSGVAAVIALRRAGFDDVVVLEKSGRTGGTWRDNTYPGCGCDVLSVLYEYSFAVRAAAARGLVNAAGSPRTSRRLSGAASMSGW